MKIVKDSQPKQTLAAKAIHQNLNEMKTMLFHFIASLSG